MSLKNYIPDEKLKILFLRSGGYFTDIYFPDAPMIVAPKSILYLAGVFKHDETVETRLLDVLAYPDFERIKKEKKDPPVYFGMSDEDIAARVIGYNPHIVAVTSTANYYVNDTIKLINHIRKTCPTAFIVVGGPDATNDYQQYFDKTSAIDAIVMQEGEITYRNLVNALRKNEDWKTLKGIAYKSNNEIIITEAQPYIEDLDEFTCDYDLVDLERYFDLNKKGYPSRLIFKYKNSHKSIDIVTSRGCPYDCSFCCIHLHMGKKFRAHSVEHVLEEMRVLIEKHDVHNFHFEDDNVLFDLERFKNILRGIIKNNWKITWDTPNGVRADLIDEEFLQLCKESGCTYLVFGIESGSKKILDKVIKKDLSLEDVVKACKLCYEYEIDTLSFFIFGMPGETKEDLLKTYYFAFDLFKKYNTTPMFQLWRPYKNTDMEKVVRNTYNVTEPVLYSYHKRYKIPYTLFYSKVYEDEEVTVEFLSYYFRKYLRDVIRIAFKNWLKITRRKPLIFVKAIGQVLFIFLRLPFNRSSTKYLLQEYLSSQGLLPFSQLNRRGR